MKVIPLLSPRLWKIRHWSTTVPILTAAIMASQQAGAQSLVWATSYSGIATSALEEVEAVVADSSGNVFATGLSGSKGIGSGIRTMKLDGRGNILWNVIHNRPALCGGMWARTPMAQEATGNLIIAGAEFTSGMDNWYPLLLRLSPTTGATLNRWIFDLGPFASFDAVSMDNSGIYILAHNNPNNGNPHVVRNLKLGLDGAIIWIDSYTPGTFWGTGGGIVATASAVYSAAGGKVTAHNLQGGIVWEREMTLPGGGGALAADATGNIYLATQNGVTKFDPAGNQLGTIEMFASSVSSLCLDATGNIYIAGSTVGTSSHGSDIVTQKYNPGGTLVWSAVYGKNGQYSDQGIAITTAGGYVYAGGSKYNKNLDMCTLKYTAGN